MSEQPSPTPTSPIEELTDGYLNLLAIRHADAHRGPIYDGGLTPADCSLCAPSFELVAAALADSATGPLPTDVDWVHELSLVIAKARHGPGVDMGGRHNPKPSEVIAARRFLEMYEYNRGSATGPLAEQLRLLNGGGHAEILMEEGRYDELAGEATSIGIETTPSATEIERLAACLQHHVELGGAIIPMTIRSCMQSARLASQSSEASDE